jgi:transcriptional regulator with XRE-family HTH domain
MSSGDSDAYAGLEIGRALEQARKRRGLSFKQVEEATKIRAGYLADLERENFDVLPAVYVQGSLKTYASFLNLDADAMVGEFKRRRSLSEEHPYPLYVGPKEDDSLDDILTALGGAAGTKSRDVTGDEEDSGPALLPAGFHGRLYLGSAAFLLLCAALVAFALTVAGDRQPAVSQVREPLISQAPEASPPRAEEDASVQSPRRDDKQKGTNDDKDESKTDRPDGSTAEDKEADPKSQNSARATASASPAAETASASPAAETASVSPPAETVSAAEERDDRREPATAEPSRRDTASVQAPARQDSTAPPSSPRPTRQPGGAPSGGNSSPPPRSNDGQIEVRVNVGGKDPVQLTGGPFDD